MKQPQQPRRKYSPAGFEEFFIENGTPVGMPTKERTEAELAMARKSTGWYTNNY